MRHDNLTEPETRAMLDSGAKLVDAWPVFLDALDGIVAQTKARGFSEEQARLIVTAIFTQAGKQR